jgi:hypothetical protein
MKRIMVLAAAALLAVGGLTPAATAGAAPYCGITWGSLAKSDPSMTGRPITNLRAGRHDCYDRLVVDLGSGPGRVGFDVAYVSVVRMDGEGNAIPLSGGAFLRVNVHAPGYDASWRPTYRPADPRHAVNVAGFSTFRQVAYGGSYEGYTTIGLGVRARLPFRVFVLSGPGTGARLVIDVAHRW